MGKLNINEEIWENVLENIIWKPNNKETKIEKVHFFILGAAAGIQTVVPSDKPLVC
jgi:hypothetical protein